LAFECANVSAKSLNTPIQRCDYSILQYVTLQCLDALAETLNLLIHGPDGPSLLLSSCLRCFQEPAVMLNLRSQIIDFASCSRALVRTSWMYLMCRWAPSCNVSAAPSSRSASCCRLEKSARISAVMPRSRTAR
jgi:hypothetical protein